MNENSLLRARPRSFSSFLSVGFVLLFSEDLYKYKGQCGHLDPKEDGTLHYQATQENPVP
jgi:hypothetical protein